MYLGRFLALAAILSVSVSKTLNGKDNSICTTFQPPPNIRSVPKPNITEHFHCRVEIVIKNKNKTEQFHEYFDDENNRGYLRQVDMDLTIDAWFNYGTNEYIVFLEAPASTPGRCVVQDLSKSSQRFMFGYNSNGPGGVGHIFSAAGALHFRGQGINEVYKGRTVVRDINVDWWRSCQYWDALDATMVVDWYFSAENSWNSAAGIQVPVQAHVKGVSYTNGRHMFEHYYNFFDFKPAQNANDGKKFETPSGVQCPGRKLTRPLPDVPKDTFSFNTEILDTTRNKLSVMKETYYYSQKLVMFEYRPYLADYSPYGTNALIEIHDFRTGVAYITDRDHGNCSYRPIEPTDFDTRTPGPNTVRIRNSREFFYLDAKNVSYEGVKNNRGIDCDTWIGSRNDYPTGFPVNSTWEWYFATTGWNQLYPAPEPGSIPVQMRFTAPSLSFAYEYNIYSFRKSIPDLLKFDISNCYEFGERRKFQFSLPVTGAMKAGISTSVKPFKYAVLKAIMDVTGVSPIRVANLQVRLADKVVIQFELLDVAPIIGDVQAPVKEIPLTSAANSLADMIKNKQFIVTVSAPVFTNTIRLIADPNSLIEITYTNITTPAATTEMTTEPLETHPSPPSPPPSSSSSSSSSSSKTTTASTMSARPKSNASSSTHYSVSNSSPNPASTHPSPPSPPLSSSSSSSSKTTTASTMSARPKSNASSSTHYSVSNSSPNPASTHPSLPSPPPSSSSSSSSSSSKTTTASTMSARPKSNASSSALNSVSKTTVIGNIKGSNAPSTDKSTRALSIAGVVIGSIIATVLAVLLVVYLKRTGKIRVRGQNGASWIDNIALAVPEIR